MRLEFAAFLRMILPGEAYVGVVAKGQTENRMRECCGLEED